MSRLIDADELKERFCEENCGKNRCVDHMDKCAWILSVEESKTAFDVDRVLGKMHDEMMNSASSEFDYAMYKAIEIVKGGGIK